MEFSRFPKGLHKSITRLTQERDNLRNIRHSLTKQITIEERRLEGTLDKIEAQNEKLNALTYAHALSPEALSMLGNVNLRSSRRDIVCERVDRRTGMMVEMRKVLAPTKMSLSQHRKVSLTINNIRSLTAQAEGQREIVISLKDRLEGLDHVLRTVGEEEEGRCIEVDTGCTRFHIRRKPVSRSSRRSYSDDYWEGNNRSDRDTVYNDDLYTDWSGSSQRRRYRRDGDGNRRPDDYFLGKGLFAFLFLWVLLIYTMRSIR